MAKRPFVQRQQKENRARPFKPTGRGAAIAGHVVNKAAPGVRLNLSRETPSKRVIDTREETPTQRTQRETEAYLGFKVDRAVNRRRKFDREDSY